MQALHAAWGTRDHNSQVMQDFHTPTLPCGCVLKLVIWNSWGDEHYVGLSGLQVFDAASGLVPLLPEHVIATPLASVAELVNNRGDVRTPDKLVRSPV